MNKATQVVAPQMIKRLRNACKNYETWKSKNKPDFKPWMHPEQRVIPPLVWNDIESTPDISQVEENTDETGVTCLEGEQLSFDSETLDENEKNGNLELPLENTV